MKTQIFLFLCLCFNPFINITNCCTFKYWDGHKNGNGYNDCFCGSEKELFSEGYNNKYCCVHQNISQNDCQVDFSTNGMWCPNATLMSMNHICNDNCFEDYYEICPDNPEACMDFETSAFSGCDGRERCETFCSGSLEIFPNYNQTTNECNNYYPYCGKRDKAKYDNHQCFKSQSDSVGNIIGFQCLNRKDISENTIRRSGNYDKFVSSRKNLFQYFKANDTRNQVNGTHIICDNQKIIMDCDGYGASVIECKKEETDNGGIFVSNFDVCEALDFREAKGLPPPSNNTMNDIRTLPLYKLGMNFSQSTVANSISVR